MRYEIEGDLLTDIADAIMEKTGKNELILPGDMPGEIAGISGSSTQDPEDKISEKYEILEYIESNGTQAIDTGIVPSANDVFYAIVTFGDDLYSWPVGGGTDTKWFGYQVNRDIAIYVGSSSSPTYNDARSWAAHPKGYIFHTPSDTQSDVSICVFLFSSE